jgi:pantetheine-phosphate adenylyltransferase
MLKTAVFPGSFDPITNGHLDIIQKAAQLFDKVIVAVGHNADKASMFSVEQRIEWIKQSCAHLPQVEVKSYTGLTIAFCQEQGAAFLIRGLRSGLDFEYEQSIAFANKEMNAQIETVFLLSSPSYSNISSTIVRDVIKHKGNYKAFVPAAVQF